MEHLDVLVIGAGLSGIGAAHYIQDKCPWASYAVLESRESIGGTWDLFKYPGIRSDSDMYTLGYSFRPWKSNQTLANGPDILDYIKETASEAGIDKHIRFNQRVVAAEWSTEDAKWTVTIERTDTGERTQLTAGFMFSCTGYYRYDKGYEPEFPGRDRFEGQIIHPQHWPEDLDYKDKKVVVIGSGATAVTLIPAMANDADHVTMLQRSPTYIVSLPQQDPIIKGFRKALPKRLSDGAIRWYKALTTQASYQLSQARPELVKKIIRLHVQRQLPKDYPINPNFTPRYNPWDQRMCVVPDGDLYKTIRRGKAEVVTDTIKTFTEKGVLLESGRELEADIIITATGLDLLFIGGMELSVDGKEVDIHNRFMYRGMMMEDVPNFAAAVGYTNASWTLKVDITCDFVTRMLNHMHKTGMRQAVPHNTDKTVEPERLLGLTSGYVMRSEGRFPLQGSKAPWRVYQNYVKDYRSLKMAKVDDGVMVYSNPAPSNRAVSKSDEEAVPA